MKLKKWLSLALTGAVSLSLLAGCQNNTPAGGSSGTPENPTRTDVQVPDGGSGAVSNPAPTGGEGGKTLVVYYSATGSTQAVAQTIADTTGGDLFELVPAEPYTSADLNWTDGNSRVSQEHDDPALRSVALTADTADNWDDYDTVFIGYPIWWGIAAWPTDSFVKNNDFTGKTVIPFCTSSSSGLGQSGELLAEMAGTGTWLEGQRFSSGAGASDVTDWVNGLELS